MPRRVDNVAEGLPQGFKTYSPYPFAGMNTEDAPTAIDDKEFVWRENFIKLGNGNLRTAWDVGSSIYTATNGRSIVWFGFYSINANYYCAVFLDDGSAVQVNPTTLAITTIGGPGTFYSLSTEFKPFLRPWGNQFILICNRNTTNDYWAWDGTLLYTAGTAAPNGVNLLSGGFNYSSTPTVTTYGGHGSGMTFSITEQAGAVVAANITNPGTGYEVGDVVQLGFSGGGSDTGAILQANLNSNGVGGVNVTAGGTGYTSATVSFSGGGGSGAAGTVIINSGVTGVPITAPGSGYTTATGSFTGGGGSGATATITINPATGAIQNVLITNPGTGYTSAPTFNFTGNGSGATFGTVTFGSGVISGVTITNPGSGYVTAPSVSFSGTGTGATGVAILSPGGVQYVSVINGGTGYTSVPLIEFRGGGGAGAVGYATLTATSIASVELTSGGSGYTFSAAGAGGVLGFTIVWPPFVQFIGGGGSGATAIPIMNGDSVGRVVVTSGGAGYTGNVTVLIGLLPEEFQYNANVGYAAFQGSGAGGVAKFSPTSISGVVVSSAGQFYTSAPTVIVEPGANNAAVALVDLMPYGVSGSAIESFLSRVWIVSPATAPYATIPGATQFLVSATSEVWNFATSAGGVLQTNVAADLQTAYTAVRQSSGYLYLSGDESVNVVSNVSTGGDPVVTTFNYQNVDPQTGVTWRDTLQDFGRAEVFANTVGVYGLYGGAAIKISAKMDRVFQNAIFPPTAGAVTPSGAIATIFDIKHYLCLMSVEDPDTQAIRTGIIAWNEKDWCVLSQSPDLIYIGTQAVGTTFNAWGTDGTDLFPLFTTPSRKITKRVDTKFYGSDRSFVVKALWGTWLTASDMSVDAQGIDGDLSAVVSGTANYNATPNPTQEGTVINQIFTNWRNQPAWDTPTPYFSVWGTAPQGAVAFTSVGLRFTSNSPDFVLSNWVIGYTEEQPIF